MSRKVHVSIRLPADLAGTLTAEASASGSTVSALIRDSIAMARGQANTEARARLSREAAAAAEAARTIADASADVAERLARLTATARAA